MLSRIITLGLFAALLSLGTRSLSVSASPLRPRNSSQISQIHGRSPHIEDALNIAIFDPGTTIAHWAVLIGGETQDGKLLEGARMFHAIRDPDPDHSLPEKLVIREKISWMAMRDKYPSELNHLNLKVRFANDGVKESDIQKILNMGMGPVTRGVANTCRHFIEDVLKEWQVGVNGPKNLDLKGELQGIDGQTVDTAIKEYVAVHNRWAVKWKELDEEQKKKAGGAGTGK
ncbi:hypothetical protein J3R30DRAFT_1222213 [Lentinula aciculospora]|uniref:Uncharacterized protein n=1 Tax=Lentinula aciculospora TaxID=153920 RepID=A0A9W9A0Y1_9AGAR|nr:hypothetical protein J3R30DRAFT_1222213 [Lentinula aciculospora]